MTDEIFDETLSDKLDAVSEAMAEYPGFPTTKTAIADQINVDRGNFSNMAAGRRPVTQETLTKLHRALRLEALGIKFSASWWTEKTTTEIKDDIRAARSIDLLDIIDDRLTPDTFFDFQGEVSGARIVLDQGASPVWAKIANKPVIAHDRLRLRTTPPIDGFMKLLVIESGLVVSMDDYLGLSHKRFKAGETETLDQSFPVSPASPEALFIAMIQPEQFKDRALPNNLDIARAITPQALAEWLRDRPKAGPELHLSALRLFLSTGDV